MTGDAAVSWRLADSQADDAAARALDGSMFVSSEVRVGEGPGRALRPSCDADVLPSVLRAFEAAIHGPSSEAMIALHAAAREFAAMERGQGHPPERAVIALKALLAGHGEGAWSPSLDADRDAVRIEARVYAELFSWFVAAFYDDERDD